MTYYYRYETKGIQRWILDSSRLRDLAGGSALIEALTGEAERGVASVGGTVRYAAAGGLLAEFPGRAELEAFASEWPMYLAYRAPGLQVVQAWVEAGGPGGLTKLVADLLPARRNVPPPPLLEAGPWLERAGRSGLPAVPRPRDLPKSKARMTQWDEPSVERERALRERGETGTLFQGILRVAEIHEDVERWPEVPIAVVHADASGVGRRIAELGGDPDVLERFSRALDEATKEATRRAVRWLRGAQRAEPLRIRPVVLGGDDLTVILPAAQARGFVATWLEAFEDQTREHHPDLGGELHAGAGVAFVNRGYPFAMAYDRAEEACRVVKASSVADGKPSASVLGFLRITTALAGTAQGSPWRLDRLDALDRLVAASRMLPRGTLRSWLGLVDADAPRVERDALWRRAREVAEERDWGAFAQALRGVGASAETGMYDGDGRDTPLRDVLVLAHVEGTGGPGERGAA